MKNYSEKDYILKRLIPLFRRLGLQNVHYTHGTDEYGRDIIFYDIDRFGIQKTYGAQVKFGDISGAAGTEIDKIIAQINNAFDMPYFDIRQKENKYIVGFYLITSGKYTRNAKEKIEERCIKKPVFFFDGEDIENLENNVILIKTNETYLELERLKREAMAAMRRKNKDVGLFEQKLNEIELLDKCSKFEKVEILMEMGLEIPLNSDIGTRLLIEQLIWQVAGWETKSLVDTIIGIKSGEFLLEKIAITLWEIGVTSVEYNRNIETVQSVIDAISNIYEMAKLIETNKTMEFCKNALDSMIKMAKREKRNEIVDSIKTVAESLTKP